MTGKLTAFMGLVATLCAGQAVAQEYASGWPHSPVGDIQTMDVQDRRLTACCLGSSGEDGVEIQLHSAFGGSVSFDADDLTGPAGREIRIRPKGWDGTVKGYVRMSSNGDGTAALTADFSINGFDVSGFIECLP